MIKWMLCKWRFLIPADFSWIKQIMLKQKELGFSIPLPAFFLNDFSFNLTQIMNFLNQSKTL